MFLGPLVLEMNIRCEQKCIHFLLKMYLLLWYYGTLLWRVPYCVCTVWYWLPSVQFFCCLQSIKSMWSCIPGSKWGYIEFLTCTYSVLLCEAALKMHKNRCLLICCSVPEHVFILTVPCAYEYSSVIPVVRPKLSQKDNGALKELSHPFSTPGPI